MDAPRSEQETEEISTEFMLKMMADVPVENTELISQTMQRCRSRLDGRPGAGRLLGPETLCPSCSTPWLCGQYRAELQPRPDATKPLRRLINKRREGRPMGPLQTRLLDRFLAARDAIVLECKRCGKVTRLPIVSRSGRGKSGPEPAQTPAQVTPGVTPASGRRRSRVRDKSAGLVIPASLRTPCTPVSRAAADGPVMTVITPELGQSPSVRGHPVSEQTPISAAPCATLKSSGTDAVTTAPIPLKKSRVSSLTGAGSVGARNAQGGATTAAIPLKKSRPGRGSGRERGGKGAVSTPVAPAAPHSTVNAREKQRRLQKILAQAECRTSDTGLMAFLSEL